MRNLFLIIIFSLANLPTNFAFENSHSKKELFKTYERTFETCYKHLYDVSPESFKAVDSLILISEQLEDDSLILNSLILKATYFMNSGKHDEALLSFDSIALKKHLLEKYPYLFYKVHVNIAISCHYTGDFKRAYEKFYYLLNQEQLSTRHTAIIYSNLGSTYITAKDYKNAVINLMKADSLYQNVEGAEFHKYRVIYNIAAAFYNTKNNNNAIKYYQKLIKLIRSEKLKKYSLYKELPHVYNCLSGAYISMDSLEMGNSMVDSALIYSQNDSLQLGVSYLRRGYYYSKKGEYKTALHFNKLSYNILKERKNQFFHLASLKSLVGVLTSLRKIEETNSLLEEMELCCSSFLTEEDSLFIEEHRIYNYLEPRLPKAKLDWIITNVKKSNGFYYTELQKSINELQEGYEADKKEKEITILNQDKIIQTERADREKENADLSRSISFISAFVSFLFLGLVIRTYKQSQIINRLREQENHAVENSYARIKGVLNQLNDAAHNPDTRFVLDKASNLVNTSAVIHKTIRAIEKTSKGSDFIFSEGFFDLCRKLERFASFERKVQINASCDENISLNPKAIQSMFLLVEELVTNSSKHAFIDQDNPQIDITLQMLEGRLVRLSYNDNGIGLPRELDIDQDGSRELGIVKSLVRKLKGKMTKHVSEGLSLQFNFDYKNISA